MRQSQTPDRQCQPRPAFFQALFLLAALVVFRIGAHIPCPGIDPKVLADLFQGQQGGILGMFNMFSGGALSRFTIFALGIMPYISASIILQLLTVVWPYLEKLSKEGEMGRRKINQYTRYGTIVLAIVQSLGVAFWLRTQQAPGGAPLVPPHVQDALWGLGFPIMTVLTLTTVQREEDDVGLSYCRYRAERWRE